IQFETGNGTAGKDAHTAANAFPLDQWVHVAVGVDRARGTALIYVNGKDVTRGQYHPPRLQDRGDEGGGVQLPFFLSLLSFGGHRPPLRRPPYFPCFFA
ncbi:LamG-like jellyroll fold domain-containing protein, partial [Chthoniobacter flavus]|uniref:LamG-like jellyroll fold domain-containing protein n=1 Tax=Chthoniobacter flavus TaxID=191863 RepID=UPI0005B25AAF